MITFDLRCDKGHPFEGWFRDRNDFDDQMGRGLLACPVCGSPGIEKQLSPVAVHVGRRSAPEPAPSPEGTKGKPSPRAFFTALAEFVETHFEDVGERFAEEARKIDSGEMDARNIRGTTTPEEEERLREEGVEFLTIALPRYDA